MQEFVNTLDADFDDCITPNDLSAFCTKKAINFTNDDMIEVIIAAVVNNILDVFDS